MARHRSRSRRLSVLSLVLGAMALGWAWSASAPSARAAALGGDLWALLAGGPWLWAGAGWLAATVVLRLLAGRRGGSGIPFAARIARRPRGDDEWGYVYVLSNPAMPGLMKVGYTRRRPRDRARELRTTGVAGRFRVEFAIKSDHARRIEAQAHRLLEARRYEGDREFMRIGREEAVAALRQAERQVKAVMSGR